MATGPGGREADAATLLDSLGTSDSASAASEVRAGRVQVEVCLDLLDAIATQMMSRPALSDGDLAFIATVLPFVHTGAGLGLGASRVVKLAALFAYYDVDKSGTLEVTELECLVVELGLEADPASARALQAEFGDVSRGDDAEGCALSFGAFLRLVAKVERGETYLSGGDDGAVEDTEPRGGSLRLGWHDGTALRWGGNCWTRQGKDHLRVLDLSRAARGYDPSEGMLSGECTIRRLAENVAHSDSPIKMIDLSEHPQLEGPVLELLSDVSGFSWSTLITLKIKDCKNASGSIPPSIGECATLQTLELQGCGFTGAH